MSSVRIRGVVLLAILLGFDVLNADFDVRNLAVGRLVVVSAMSNAKDRRHVEAIGTSMSFSAFAPVTRSCFGFWLGTLRSSWNEAFAMNSYLCELFDMGSVTVTIFALE